MNQTTIIGSPFEGVLHHEQPLPLCVVIHVTVMEEIPDLRKGDQHAELRRGHYTRNPETGGFEYVRTP